MKGVFNKVEIIRLKANARSVYRKIQSCRDNLSCGMNLARHISPQLTALESKFEKIMEQLKKIDPDAPRKKREPMCQAWPRCACIMRGTRKDCDK